MDVIDLGRIESTPLTSGDEPDIAFRAPRIWATVKRGIDVVTAAGLLLALLPVMVIVALAVRFDSRGPAVFRQERYGRGRRRFVVLKFRTMYVDASSEMHRAFIAQLADGTAPVNGLCKLTGDPRVTRVGRFLRRTSLDELPQLLNVLRGDMSLVGPRPAIEYELEHYGAEHLVRFNVRPGLTGLWQVKGRSELGFREMLDLDAEYARHCDLRTDAEILLRTPRAVLSRRAA
jgi:lipopolysaccharide/colanic/teichoic acid biosynthesis glycosyltransferase